jgi:hypothetical protein
MVQKYSASVADFLTIDAETADAILPGPFEDVEDNVLDDDEV